MFNTINEDNLNNNYINNNLLTLRKKLNLTQQEFIDKYLTINKRALISIPKLSNIERGNSYRYLDRILSALSENLKLPIDSFSLPNDKFIEKINMTLGHLIDQNKHVKQYSQLIERHPNATQELVKVISNYLIDNVLSGSLAPGYRIPSDREMTKIFGVGRTAIREAMKVLNVLGLIDIRPGQGTFLANNSNNFFLTPLDWTLLMNKQNIENICEVRLLLESETARLAAKNATEAQLKKLRQILISSEQSLKEFNYKQFLDLDIQFHLQLAQSSGNQIIESLLLTIRTLMKQMSSAGMTTIEDMEEIYSEHTALYNAIVNHDHNLSVENMRKHLQAAYQRNGLL